MNYSIIEQWIARFYSPVGVVDLTPAGHAARCYVCGTSSVKLGSVVLYANEVQYEIDTIRCLFCAKDIVRNQENVDAFIAIAFKAQLNFPTVSGGISRQGS